MKINWKLFTGVFIIQGTLAYGIMFGLPGCSSDFSRVDNTYEVTCITSDGAFTTQGVTAAYAEEGILHIENEKGEHFFVAGSVCNATPEIMGRRDER